MIWATSVFFAWSIIHLYLCIHFLILFSKLREKRYATMAAITLSFMVFCLGSTIRNESTTIFTMALSHWLKVTSAFMFQVAFSYLVSFSIGRKKDLLPRILAGWTAIVVSVNTILLLHFTSQAESKNFLLEQKGYLSLLLIEGSVVTIFYGISIFRSFQSLDRSFEKIFSVMLGVLGVVFVIHDLLNFFHLIRSTYLLEYFSILISLFYTNIAQKKSIEETKKLLHQKGEIERSLEKLREAEVELEKSSQLASIGELSGEIAKAFNDPLILIDQKAAILKTKDLDYEEQIKIMEKIEGLTQKLNLFIQELLVYAKPYNPVFNRKSLRKIIVRAFEDALVSKTELEKKSQPEIGFQIFNMSENEMIEADSERLTLSFKHLFINAMDAIADKGEVKVCIREYNDGLEKYFEIKILDNGKGFGDQSPERFLKPFSTTYDHKPGLGLCIVQRIVDEHHGMFGFGNQKTGHGVEVKMVLPTAQQQF